MKSLEELKDAADRAFELLEQKSPHQLAVELVSMEDRVQAAIDACARMQEQRDQLAFQLKDATAQCAVAADLLRELREGAEIHLHNCIVCKNEQGIANWTSKLERIDAALAGELPETSPSTTTNWPDKCPITRRDFFMEIDGVPTYGGPLDSYTIPEMLGVPEQPWHERELFVRRFDHDQGCWVDDEVIPLRVIHDEVLDDLLDDQVPEGGA